MHWAWENILKQEENISCTNTNRYLIFGIGKFEGFHSIHELLGVKANFESRKSQEKSWLQLQFYARRLCSLRLSNHELPINLHHESFRLKPQWNCTYSNPILCLQKLFKTFCRCKKIQSEDFIAFPNISCLIFVFVTTK